VNGGSKREVSQQGWTGMEFTVVEERNEWLRNSYVGKLQGTVQKLLDE